MCLIAVPNLKEVNPGEGCFFWLKVIVLSWCEEEKQDIKILNLKREVGIALKSRRQVASLAA